MHVVRDPRDTVVSGYFSHRDSHPAGPWLDEHRARLQRLDLHDGLLAELTFKATRRVMSEVQRWDYDQDDVLEVRMEDLIDQPLETMREAFEFLGLDAIIAMDELLRIVEDHRFEAKTGGRQRGEEDQANHYRKGIAGDWRNYFRHEHIQLFKELFGDVLVTLGYETDDSWG